MKGVFIGTVVAALVLGGGFVAYKWSGARGEVAKTKVLNHIDKMLGESDVERAEIDRGIKGMDKAIEALSEARIKAQVQAEILGRELGTNKQKLAEGKVVLAKLRDELSAFDSKEMYTVSYGAKTYSKKEDLDRMSQKVIENHKALKDQTEAMEKRLETYKTTATTLSNREAEAKSRLTKMGNRLRELDAKIAMVKAKKAAAEALSETDKTFAGSIAGIEEKIKELDIKTETAVRREDEKWKEYSAATEVEDASKIINSSKNTISEIDALLGK